MATYNSDAPLITLEDIYKARKCVEACPQVIRTPLVQDAQGLYGIDSNVQLYLKLESLQYTGSFKSRGVVYQLSDIPEGCGTQHRKLLTMSAGNYGKAFAYITRDIGLHAKVIMPETAPINRVAMIQGCGLEVQCVPSAKISEHVEKDVTEQGMVFFHPFDDVRLMAAYASVGLEILEDVPSPDVVLVCCGGGGLLSGVASAIKLSCPTPCRVYGVEPENSRTMHESFAIGSAATMDAHSVAAGLSPPFAGKNCYKHCRQHVDDIILVSDKEIVAAMFHLYERRLLVEPSGAAAFSALLHGKVPDVQGKKVVVVITGGNVSPQELVNLSKDT